MREQVSVFTYGSHGGSAGKYQHKYFSEILALYFFLTDSDSHSTLAAEWKPLTCMERWENVSFTALTDSSVNIFPIALYSVLEGDMFTFLLSTGGKTLISDSHNLSLRKKNDKNGKTFHFQNYNKLSS